MTDLERFRATMNYQPVDHHPFWVWGPWPETVERWKTEGCDETVFNWQGGADRIEMHGSWFQPNPPFERKVVEEDEAHILYVNHEGILMREMKRQPWSSMPQFVKFPVETRDEFRRFWKQRMRPDLSHRIGPDWRQILIDARARPYPLIVWADRWGGFFGPVRNLVGVEDLCTLFYDEPDFVQEMMDADADFIIAMMSQILDVVSIDAFSYWEDMAYNTAPLISPELVRRYMLPRYKRVNGFLRSRGVEFIALDSDGRINFLIPIWLESGINCLFPFEVQCGMDVLAVRREFGKDLRLWGGVDKRALAKGPKAIDAELARLKPLIDEGGYIPHTDHSIPPDVSFASFQYYLTRIEDICRS